MAIDRSAVRTSYGPMMQTSPVLVVSALLIVGACASSASTDGSVPVENEPSTTTSNSTTAPTGTGSTDTGPASVPSSTVWTSPSTVAPSSVPTATQLATTQPATTQPATTQPATTITTTTVPAQVESAGADLGALVVADPALEREPYERDRYDGKGWADVDGDCLSTRHELLLEYSLIEPALATTECRIETGRWVDPFDGVSYTSESEVSIDHLVPLAEAHRSGAWKWDDETKQRFANDEHPGHLLVVGRDSNQAKADKRPDEWLPPDPAAHCQYAIDWITTKSRYGLTVTARESTALAAALESCASTPRPVRPAGDATTPVVAVTIPTTTTTSTIAPSDGPGLLALLSCDKRGESVTIANTGGETITLVGFLLHDDGAKHSTELGGFGALAPGEQLRILTGPDATAGPDQVVWKNQNVWNNDGDTAHLIGFGVEQTVGC